MTFNSPKAVYAYALAIGCAVFFNVASAPAAADVAAIGFTDGDTASDSDTNGWRFQALSDINVTLLGAWDEGANGLSTSVEVGIWTDAGVLLGSLLVAGGTGPTLLDGFRYQAVAIPIPLTAGQFYRVGSRATDGGIAYQVDVTDLVVAPEIDFFAGYFDSGSGALAFPDSLSTSLALPDSFGANFQYVAAVPEASSLAFGGLASAIGAVLYGARILLPRT